MITKNPIPERNGAVMIPVLMRKSLLKFLILLFAIGCGTFLYACGNKNETGRTLEVPQQFSTITDAVAAAKSGDLVLIDSGIYTEQILVETKNIVIRGRDRNAVVIDGEFTRENGFMVFADGVAIENLTVRNAKANGIIFLGDYYAGSGHILRGYRVSDVTVINNLLYGVYAFISEQGRIERVAGSGHPDAAIYIGQCAQCDAIVTEVYAERNMIGIQAANASGVSVLNSHFSRNRIGVQLINNNQEKQLGQVDITVAGNIIENNGDPETPTATNSYGYGVTISGGSNNKILRNRIRNSANGGVVVTGPEKNFVPTKNEIRDNDFMNNPLDVIFSLTGKGNCVTSAAPIRTSPESLLATHKCDQSSLPEISDSLPTPSVSSPPGKDPKTLAPLAPVAGMDDPAHAPIRPAHLRDPQPDLTHISLPAE